jgi:hypothetical protein
MSTTNVVCLSEAANVAAKYQFRAILLKAITKKDMNAFKACVEQIGLDWHVSRTVETNKKDAFSESLWNNREAILSGKYEWNKSPYNAYSYESKVCFLLNPVHYKLIFDSQIQTALNETNRDKWQERVERYYQETLQFSPEDETDIDRIFREDYKLWAKDSEKIWLSGSSGRIVYKVGVTFETAQNLTV